MATSADAAGKYNALGVGVKEHVADSEHSSQIELDGGSLASPTSILNSCCSLARPNSTVGFLIRKPRQKDAALSYLLFAARCTTYFVLSEKMFACLLVIPRS